MTGHGRCLAVATAGLTNSAIAGGLGIDKHTAGMWRKRSAAARLDGLRDEPRPRAPRQIGDDAIAETTRITLESRPAGATHWSLRSVAPAAGYAPSLSSDPMFVEKVRDIVGLHLDPPDRAVVLCLDEKSQIQALDRTQPLLPMRPGRARPRR